MFEQLRINTVKISFVQNVCVSTVVCEKKPTNRRTDARQGVTQIAHVFNSRGELIWH